MRLAFYMPLKPPDHPNPSGDLVQGRAWAAFLHGCGHELVLASRLRSRGLLADPTRWPSALVAMHRAVECARTCHAWLTYHAYWKAPDLLGPLVRRRLGIPYVIIQAAYSTKRRKRWASWSGFQLNRRSLRAADLVVANKRVDFTNLGRIIAPHKLIYAPPGIRPEQFTFDATARETWRQRLGVGETPVILTAAMLRPDVKRESVAGLLHSLALLRERDFLLVVAGDGQARPELEALARSSVGDKVRFLGQLPRPELAELMSAADVFAFPGVGESFGMVYLEAQAIGLPVAAWRGWGAEEAVAHGRSGLLTPAHDLEAYAASLARLLDDAGLRSQLGRAAAERVRRDFDLHRNFAPVAARIRELAEAHARTQPS